MAQPSIIIIGAGVAGLSAGCYGQMNGYRTTIFEMGDRPGGLCTSWTRQGYTFDGCIQWLVGSGQGQNFNTLWQELGAVQGRQFVNHEEFIRIEGANGKTFIMYTDIDRLEAHMKALAPSDARVIEACTTAMRHFAHFDLNMDKPRELYSPVDYLEMGFKTGPHLRDLLKYSKLSIHEFVQRFSDPFLREVFDTLYGGMPDFPMMGLLMTSAFMANQNAGYPIGGSLAFAQAIEQRYRALGGELRYHAPVRKILVEGDRACGVQLADGSVYRADDVISAADGHATLFALLEGKYLDEEIQGYYDDSPRFRPLIQVSLGVARDLSPEPHAAFYPLRQPATIAGEVLTRMGFRHYGFDPTMAPAGKSVVIVSLPSDYAYWRQRSSDQALYSAEKQQVAHSVIAALEQRFPGITEQIEVTDVVTPLTYEQYTGNWEGCPEGWLLTTTTMGMMIGKGMQKTLPGLEHFYMAGHWVEPGGGVPTVAASGRKAIQLICHRDHQKFTASVPEAVSVR